MERKKSNRYGRRYGKKSGHPSDLQTPSEDRCKRQNTPPVGGLQSSCQEKREFQRKKWREHSQKRHQIKGS